jgi:uncharacterized protein (DUF488 family)
MTPPLIRTVGHGTAGESEFVDLLRGAGVETVVDVRRFPGSRRHPHFGTDAMARWLPAADISYRWSSDLGGRRKPDAESPNVGLRNLQFRAYADHMATPVFAAAVEELLQVAAASRVAVMCSESVWWRCHRRLVADHLVVVEGCRVEHLFHDGRLVEHAVTDGARRADHHLAYWS